MKLKKVRVYLRNIITAGQGVRAANKSIVNALCYDMQRIGLTNPIMVCKARKELKRVYIADGYFRLLAYKKLNSLRPPSRRRKTIDCFVQINSEVVSLRAEAATWIESDYLK
jgi:hypothetical protein